MEKRNGFFSSVGDKLKTAGSKVGSIADLNGDGKVDAEDVKVALDKVYDLAINGVKVTSKPINEVADEYLKKYEDPRKAAEKLIDNAVMKCTTTGFLTGLGGLITLPVAIPADLSTTWYVQLRMIAAVAYMTGLDIHDDMVRTLSYACLAGVSVGKIVQQAGIKTGVKLTQSLIKRIPGAVIVKINQKVGFRFLTKAGTKGIVNLAKMVPVVGGVISGGIDFAETKIIANRAIKQFMEGDFSIPNATSEDCVEA